ncbi:hypothetical protein NDU88_007201 [Pleurodeles waltl]|uniref:ribonuclease H n=1 Tax=Pleurodeles waltl TaxID=8319 RepID=A0AAV7QR69_PLEWA|nr:hypothetical protein NDU88_007201 [Pleurodeles waltl]
MLFSRSVAVDTESHVVVGQGTRGLPSPPLPLLQPPNPPSLSSHSGPVGGRIRPHLPYWESITTDRWVLQIVRRGYSLPFNTAPPAMPPSFSCLPEDHLAVLCQEVTALLAKGALKRAPAPLVGCGCYYHCFLVSKKDKGLCPILDLWVLNLLLKKEKFKMPTLFALVPGDWMVALDLQDDYFHIPILPTHRPYLQFVVGNEHFQLTVLPFSLTSAPRVFTKVMAVDAAHLRRFGVSVFPYLDDWLLKANSPQKIAFHLPTTASLLHRVGFTINVSKSHQTASQTLPFIGAVLDTVQFRTYPPEKRVQDIHAMILIFGFCENDSEAAGPHGLLLVTHARWHMQALQWDLKFQWAQHQRNLSDRVQISEGTAKDQQWWLSNRYWVDGRSLFLPQPDLSIVMDASFLGWGGRMGEVEIRGL